jgi:hypothetical protein
MSLSDQTKISASLLKDTDPIVFFHIIAAIRTSLVIAREVLDAQAARWNDFS